MNSSSSTDPNIHDIHSRISHLEASIREIEIHTSAAGLILKKLTSSLMVKKFGLNEELRSGVQEAFGQLDKIMEVVYRADGAGPEGEGII